MLCRKNINVRVLKKVYPTVTLTHVHNYFLDTVLIGVSLQGFWSKKSKTLFTYKVFEATDYSFPTYITEIQLFLLNTPLPVHLN